MEFSVFLGIFAAFIAWIIVLILMGGIYTVDQNERAIKTTFGRAPRLTVTTLDDPISANLNDEEKQRYQYPQVRVIMPGGPYFKLPWQKVYKVSIATQTLNMAYDPELQNANNGGTILEAVTKDQLNTGLTGQIRYHISERNLYAYLFGIAESLADKDHYPEVGIALGFRVLPTPLNGLSHRRLPGLIVVCFGRFWIRGLPFPNARRLGHPFQWKNTLPWHLGPASKVRILRFKNLPRFRHYRGLQNHV
jgi:hypothetical protein